MRDRCHHFFLSRIFRIPNIRVVSRNGTVMLAAVLGYHPADTVVRRFTIAGSVGVCQITRR